MRKVIVLTVVFLFFVSDVFAFAIKVYDEYGNRVGTYRKEGDNYQLYDFNDEKVDNPENLIKNAPDKKTLTEYSRTFYDENMIPIGTWHSGYYGNNRRYYSGGFQYFQPNIHRIHTPYIVRPGVNNGLYPSANYRNNINYINTRIPKTSRTIRFSH